MLEEDGDIVYVTIGVPFSSIPIMEKVMIFVDPKRTPIQAAKELRKNVADSIEDYGWVRGTNFKPSELYYEIFENRTDEKPTLMSFKSPYRKEHIDGRS